MFFLRSWENKELGGLKVTTHLNSVPPLFNPGKLYAIQTIIHPISGDPLIGVLSSLGGYSSYLHCSSKVHLQPLIVVVMTCTPRSHVPSAFSAVKSTKKRNVKIIVRGRSCHGLVSDSSFLNPHSSVTEVFCIKGEGCISQIVQHNIPDIGG